MMYNIIKLTLIFSSMFLVLDSAMVALHGLKSPYLC